MKQLLQLQSLTWPKVKPHTVQCVQHAMVQMAIQQ
jgi:hypothetical protein